MTMKPRGISHDILRLILVGTCFVLLSCTILKSTYTVIKGTYTVTKGTLKLGYHVAKFTGKTVG